MSLNDTPSANRTHIAFFGVRNAGKSSVMNAVTGQKIAIVSPVKGTTTDPVSKSMELLPLGPVTIIDTPGLDDEGTLGEMRVAKTREVLRRTDIAVLVTDARCEVTSIEREIILLFQKHNLPYLIAYNKIDCGNIIERNDRHAVYISAKTGDGINELKERLAHIVDPSGNKTLLGDLVHRGDTAILVIPIDKAAPKGRLILPQQQVIRELLDCGAKALMVQCDQLADALKSLNQLPALVITDSQAFGMVNKIVAPSIPLTSFSILFARYKGDLPYQIEAVKQLDTLKDGDKILISEGCTHHRQCDDIGTVKLPRWLCEYTKKKLDFSYTSGTEFPDDLSAYRLVIHCGACMLNEKEMAYRLKIAKQQNIYMANYGTIIAYVHGILPRATKILGY